MDIKKANVNLLLGKIRTYLDKQPEGRKKGKRFMEAEKALAKLQKFFAGQDGVIEVKACKSGIRVIDG